MRILFLGDIVGRAARRAIMEMVPKWRSAWRLDFVIVNAENAAGGFGVTEKICNGLFAAGVDVLTSGNHIWDQSETLSHIAREPRLLRPLNYASDLPGRGTGLFALADSSERRVLVLNAQGQLFMGACDNPFAAVERELAACPLGQADAIVLDFHTEASSEIMAMGHVCDGRASLVIGTHTHVPSADAQILPRGTAYLSDAGMCGDYVSVIGMEAEEGTRRMVSKLRAQRLEPAAGAPTLCGALVETDDSSGLARGFWPVRIGGRLQQALPAGCAAED